MSYTPYKSASTSPSSRPLGAVQVRARWRSRVLPTLRGDVLDVGAGEGAALDHLAQASTVALLEPHARTVRRLRARAANRPGTRVLHGHAERIPLPEASVDVAVCCMALCSVRDQDRALEELRRVLRPGGELVLLEHVVAGRGTWLRLGQRLAAPTSRWFDRGCDPARDTEAALCRSALHITRLRRFEAGGPWDLAIPHLEAVLTHQAPASTSSRGS